MRSPLRSPAQVEGTQGFLPQPGKDLERPSSTRLEARFPSLGSGAVTRSPSPLAWRPDFPGAPREAHCPRRRTSGETAHWGRRSRTTPRFPRHREMRAFVSCMAWRPISRPLSKRLRRLDSLESPQCAPRDTRRDSRAERGSLLPLEMKACLPGCVWNATPRSLSPPERNIGFWTQAWMRSIGPAVTREQCPALLRNSNGRLDLPGPTQEAA